MIDLTTYQQYRNAIQAVYDIERELAKPARRKDTRLILAQMRLCGAIHAYEAAREALAQRKVA